MLHNYYESAFLTVQYSTDKHYGLLTWKGAVTMLHYEQALDVIREFNAEKKMQRLICDMRQMHTIAMREEYFLKEVFIPSLMRLHLTNVGIAVSRMVYNELILKRIIDKTRYPKVNFVETPEQALRWLETQKEMPEPEVFRTPVLILHPEFPEPATIISAETTPIENPAERSLHELPPGFDLSDEQECA